MKTHTGTAQVETGAQTELILETAEILTVDDNQPEDYEDWIRNWARVYQMVDYDKAPVIISEGKNFRAVFPAIAFGEDGKIVHKNGEYLLLVDGQLYHCVSIILDKERADDLRKKVKTRLLQTGKQAAVRKHNSRYQK